MNYCNNEKIAEEILGKSATIIDHRQDKPTMTTIGRLVDFRGHPYKVEDNAEMDALVESIRANGILNPIIIRPVDHGFYEIISGHRRVHACKRLGMTLIPAVEKEMTQEEATILMVDSNLHRERLLPSEKAFAYKMKLDALKRQGKRNDLTSEQVAPKLATEVIAEQENTSKDTIKRYIRLTNLIKPLFDLVDQDKIAFTPAEKLSYLKKEEQQAVAEWIEDNEGITPSLSQAVKLKEASVSGKFNGDTVHDIMDQPKANQKETLKLDMEKLRAFFPNHTPKDMESAILKILSDWEKREQSKAQSRSSWDKDGR